MDRARRPAKPYTTYRAGDPEALAPPSQPGDRPRRRRRTPQRALSLLLLVVGCIAVAAVAGGIAWSAQGDDRAPAVQAPNGEAAATTSSPSAPPSPSPTPSPSASTPDPQTVGFTITAGGDVIGDRSIRYTLSQHKPAGPFRKTASYWRDSDVALVNLETPLTNGGSPQSWKDVVFKGDPRLAKAMAAVGIDVVTMANNHAMDQGASGLLDSIRWCEKAGIKVCGAGKDLAAARAAQIETTKKGTRVAFVGFTDVLPAGFPATSSSAGTAPGRSSVSAMKKAVAAAARKADYTVVSWHWNFEYTTAPTSLETSQAKAAIDSGADLVIAHHPHVLQGVQAYHGGLIAYSLGDLVFDHCSGPMAQTVLVRAKVTGDGIEAKLIPAQLDYAGTPSIAHGATARAILGRVKSYSASLGTKVTIRGDVGYVTVKR